MNDLEKACQAIADAIPADEIDWIAARESTAAMTAIEERCQSCRDAHLDNLSDIHISVAAAISVGIKPDEAEDWLNYHNDPGNEDPFPPGF